MEWSFTAAGPVRAEVDVPAGSIEISPAVAGEVTVELEPSHPGSTRSTEAIESAEVSLEGDRLEVRVGQRGRRARLFSRDVEVTCRIAMPEGSSLSVTTASADVTCAVALAAFTANVASADVTLGRVDGAVELVSASGDLRCESAGSLAVKGASADVSVRRVTGPVDVNVASGDVAIEEAGSSVQMKSASGDLELGSVTAGDVKFDTASGDIRIGVAAGTGAHLDVTTVSGELRCDLPMSETGPESAALRIACRSVSGDVTIASATA